MKPIPYSTGMSMEIKEPRPTSKELASYDSDVEVLALANSKYRFSNSGLAYSSIVLSKIFKYSSKIIRMYANNLSGNIVFDSPECIPNLENFLHKKGVLKIIVENEFSGGRFFEKLKSWKNTFTKIEVRKSNQSFKDKFLTIDPQFNYFAVGDEKIIRAETDPELHHALCCFNEPTTVKKINKIFDSSFSNCEKIL